jgi:UDP-GlcNAc:undecaprenyl-phosphate GlcNAc-1-phosphate transferase
MTTFVSFLFAMLVTMALIPPLIASAVRWKILDLPDEARKQHTHPVPRVGGIAMTAGSVLPMVIWLIDEPAVIGFLLGVACILVAGVWDDRRPLDYRIKFFAQIAAAAIAVRGGIVIETLPFAGPDPVPAYIAKPFTIFALVGITNAINLADGLDGLAGGTTLLSLLLIALLAWNANDMTVVLMAIAVTGSTLGFLRFNTYPAQVFMGDAGSQFLGYSVGVLAILLTQQSNPALSQALPVLLLGLPILDTFLVMGQRVYEHRSPFSPDRNHIHHKLLALGFDHYEAVVCVYALQAVLVTTAYFLRYESDALVMGLYVGLFVLIALGFRIAHRYGWRVRTAHPDPPAPFLRRQAARVRTSGLVTTVAAAAALAAVLLVLGAAFVAADQASWGITATALGLAAVHLLASVLWRGHELGVIERAVIYMILALAVYLQSLTPHPYANEVDIAFVALALLLIAGFRYSPTAAFRFTPLDFLVLFAAVVIPNLPAKEILNPQTSSMVTKLFVLLYATEFLLNRTVRRPDWARAAGICAAIVIGLRAMLG